MNLALLFTKSSKVPIAGMKHKISPNMTTKEKFVTMEAIIKPSIDPVSRETTHYQAKNPMYINETPTHTT